MLELKSKSAVKGMLRKDLVVYAQDLQVEIEKLREESLRKETAKAKKPEGLFKTIELTTSGNGSVMRNGALELSEDFEFEGSLYRISIHSESHISQSYIKGFKFDGNDFKRIYIKNPSRDYGITISYENKSEAQLIEIFSKAIMDFKLYVKSISKFSK